MLFMAKNGLTKRRSGSVARNRSTDTMLMMKNDLIRAVDKYFSVDSSRIQIQFQQDPPMMLARIPILQEKDNRKDHVKTV